MFYFLYPPLHSTHIVLSSFGNLVNILHAPWLWIDSGWFFLSDGLDIGTALFRPWWYWIKFFVNNLVFKERQFVWVLHVINEVSIDTCDIHQIKENAEVKSNRWLLIQTISSSTLVHKINFTHAAIVKLDNLKTKNRRLGLWTLFSLLN